MAQCAVFMMPTSCSSREGSSSGASSSLCPVERRRQEEESGLANTEPLQKGQGMFLFSFSLSVYVQCVREWWKQVCWTVGAACRDACQPHPGGILYCDSLYGCRSIVVME